MTTRSTTTCSRGDIILVPFQFTDQPVAKRRPAVVISSDPYHRGRDEVIIAALTSRIRSPLLVGDHLIKEWRQAGLPKPSVATAILRTVKGNMIVRRVGSLGSGDMLEIDKQLRKVMSL
jgi:mRNA interferase MazF